MVCVPDLRMKSQLADSTRWIFSRRVPVFVFSFANNTIAEFRWRERRRRVFLLMIAFFGYEWNKLFVDCCERRLKHRLNDYILVNDDCYPKCNHYQPPSWFILLPLLQCDMLRCTLLPTYSHQLENTKHSPPFCQSSHQRDNTPSVAPQHRYQLCFLPLFSLYSFNYSINSSISAKTNNHLLNNTYYKYIYNHLCFITNLSSR